MIELYTQDNHTAKLVREACAGVCELEVVSPDYKDLPKYFDLCATSTQLNAGVERFAAGYGAMVLVLPEGGGWLAAKGQTDHVSVVGADYRRVKW